MKIKGAHDSDNIYSNKMLNSTTDIVYSLIGITLFVGVFLSNIVPNVSADTSVVSTAVIDVPSSCSMTATVDTAHNATLINGIYSGGNDYYPNGIGQTTLTAFCNDASGFAIYAVGFSDDEYGATNMIGTNTGTTIPTGTATSGANSQWAMKLTKVTDSTAYNPANMTITNGYDDYSAVPDDYEKVANFSSATDQTLGAKLTTTYAAYISNTQPADTYTGKVKYTLVHPSANIPNKPYACSSNKICYWPNAGDMTAGGVGVEDTMGDQSVGNTTTSITLWASNFKRPGYGFAGWSDAYDYVINEGSESNPNAHIYGPNETIEFTAGQYSAEGLPLYAVWVPSAGSIQDWTGCNSLASGAVTALTDQRDDNTYAVAKLADGKCWMIENLRLDNANSDNATGDLAQGYGKSTTYGNFIGLANPETTNITAANGVAAANSLYYSGTQTGTATINISTIYYPEYRMPRYRNDNTNTDSTINPNTTTSMMTGTNQNVSGYGNYYTWAAALANTIYYRSATATDADGKTSETVGTSVCPAGWRLPRGGEKSRIEGGTSDYYGLFLAVVGEAPSNYNTTTQPNWTNNNYSEGTNASRAIRSHPNNFLFAGFASGSTISDRGGTGFYWASTATSDYHYSYGAGVYGTMLHPGTVYTARATAYSIRCMLDN